MLQDLNDPQRTAVTHEGGALLIVAGPGSGKTRVITHRAAHQIAIRGIAADRILCLTFTNKAAQEMQTRLSQMIANAGQKPVAGTFHSFCNTLLRAHQDNSVVDPDFTILDPEDQTAMVRDAMDACDVSTQRYNAPNIKTLISAAKNRMQQPADLSIAGPGNYADTGLNAKTIAAIYARYETICHGQNCLDFDDLLIYAVRLLDTNLRTRQRIQRRYRSIMVDEFQDTNALQYRLIRLLTADGQNLAVVGDPDQCIYTWRNADPRNLERFKTDFAPVATVTLGQNYRSTGQIVQASANVISYNPGREPISLCTENAAGPAITENISYDPGEEAEWIIGQAQELLNQGYQPSDIAIAYRTHRQSRLLEAQSSRHNIPYRLIGGFPFWQRAEIKDITAYLATIVNPANQVAYRRAAATPPQGIGARTMDNICDFAAATGGNIAQAINALAHNHQSGLPQPFPIRNDTASALANFNRRQAELQTLSNTLPLSGLVAHILADYGLKDHIRKYDQPQERWDNVLELQQAAAQLDHLPAPQAIAQMLADAALSTSADQPENDAAITLITLHQTKGLEWPAVFIAGMIEGALPLSRAETVDEERRLCYVGMTRAKERLYLSSTDQNPWGYAADPSRFIDESKTARF